MTVPRSGIPVPVPDAGRANRRKHGRFRVQGFGSSLGQVLNISATGAQIRFDATAALPVGQSISVVVETPNGPVNAVARVVWWRRAGWFGHEAGLEFRELTPSARAAFAALAKSWDERE